jgi:hypothetical protein
MRVFPFIGKQANSRDGFHDAVTAFVLADR